MTDNSHQLDDINPHTGEPYKERPNKTQLKREMKVFHDLGKELVALAESKLSELTLSERMMDAILAAKKMKKSALQRQLRFISSIIQEEDTDAIRLQLNRLALPQLQANDAFHEVEDWRDRLVSGDNELINELLERFTNADRQYIRQLVRNANKETQLNKAPKSSRMLFKYLKELQEQHHN